MLGISRKFGYDLVKKVQIPLVKFRKGKLMARVALEKMLENGVPELVRWNFSH